MRFNKARIMPEYVISLAFIPVEEGRELKAEAAI